MQQGVFECQRGTDVIHVIVAGELPQTENNSLLHLLSASFSRVGFGAAHYQQYSDDTSSLLNRLIEGYRREGVNMPYTMEDFRRDYAKEHVKELTPEELLEALPHRTIEELYKRSKQRLASRNHRKKKKPGSAK